MTIKEILNYYVVIPSKSINFGGVGKTDGEKWSRNSLKVQEKMF
jgi:hypothetical protein